MFDTTCDDCGKECQVPFKPVLNEDGSHKYPVYCRDCFQKHKGESAPKRFDKKEESEEIEEDAEESEDSDFEDKDE